MSVLNSRWQELRKSVDGRLEELLRELDGCPSNLMEALRYSLLAPGKRLRPLLTVLAAEAVGGDADHATTAGCAVEMIHTYSLIHDDLPAMDDDDLRRGKPTCHKQFGEAMAILAGDALLTLAFQVLADHYPSATAAGCCRELAIGAGAGGMVGGQVEDLAWEQSSRLGSDQQTHTLAGLESIHAKKTGALFRAALRMGVWTACGEAPDGPSKELLERLDEFGRCFGMVFQITDDLLDVEGDTQHLGKRAQKDAGRGKLTYPGFLGLDESRSRASDLAKEGRELLRPLGDAGNSLVELLQFVVKRDR